jgi:Rod binding domain-containing protein
MEATAPPQTLPLPPADTAARDPKIWQAAQNFEAMAIGQMLAPMFDTVDVAHSKFGGGEAEAAWRPMLVDAIGKQMAAHGGFGLAQPIYAAMLRAQEAGTQQAGVQQAGVQQAGAQQAGAQQAGTQQVGVLGARARVGGAPAGRARLPATGQPALSHGVYQPAAHQPGIPQPGIPQPGTHQPGISAHQPGKPL